MHKGPDLDDGADGMDVLDLARLQFALTASLHFLFVVLTLGMAPVVAVLNTRWVRTGDPLHERMTRFWGQIYVINYALGIVTGLVMEFQFGLSWSGLAHYAGDVFGAPLAVETMGAFFLESTFLGLWIFGWHRLPRLAHLACIWAVTLTAFASAFWIMAANSFLQNPQGAVVRGDRLALSGIGDLLTNEALVFSFPHVIGAGLTTGAFVVIGASAYRLWRRQDERELFTRSLRFGVALAAGGSLVTVFFGFAQFSTVPTGKFDGAAAGTGLGLMILIGQLLLTAALLILLPVIRWLPRWRWAHPVLLVMTPLPFAAAILGWIAREMGRHPWMIRDRLTVADALSPGLTPGMITASLVGFTAVLGLLAVVDYVLIARAVRRGPADLLLGAPPVPDDLPDERPATALSH